MKKTLIILLFCITTSFLLGQQSLAEEGWEAWKSGNYDLAVNKFNQTAEGNEAVRSKIAMMMLNYSTKLNDAKTPANQVEILKDIQPLVDDFRPYYFASNFISSPSTGKEMEKFNLKLLKIYRDDAFFKAYINSMLSIYYRDLGKLKKSEKYTNSIPYLKNWKLIGPFENTSLSGMKEAFEPETEYVTDKTYIAKDKLGINWIDSILNPYNNWLDFRNFYYSESGVYYANTFFYLPNEQEVIVSLGYSGAAKLFINDTNVYESYDEENNGVDTYKIKTTLNKGWNKILLKVGCDDSNSANFLVRITDLDGNEIEGSTESTNLKEYSKDEQSYELLENENISFFKNKIELEPENFDNYLMLINAQFLLGKTDEVEMLLDESEKVLGPATIFDLYRLTSYITSGKNAKISEYAHKIYNADKHFNVGQEFKIQEALGAEDVENAKILLAEHEEIFGKTTSWYNSSIQLEGLKGDEANILKAADNAINAYPDHNDFIVMDIIVKFQQKMYEEAKLSAKHLLDVNYSKESISYAALISLQTGDVNNWVSYMQKAIELNPANIFTYLSFGESLKDIKQYKYSLDILAKATAINPQIEKIWPLQAACYSLLKDDANAKISYETALEKSPLNYNIRHIIRELEGKKDIFAEFTEYDPKLHLNPDIQPETYPNDNAVILDKDINMIIFENGGAESSSLYLYKILNDKGLKEFKVRNLGENFRYGATNILEAKIIKPDGTVKNADINGAQAVFEDLEVNDYIFYKLKTEYYFNGMFSGEFWEEVELNALYPTKRSHFRLSVPQDRYFSIISNIDDLEPVVTTDGELKTYDWEILDEPAVKDEDNMPMFREISKKESITSIGSWEDIAIWYDKVTENKHKVDYEVEKLSKQLFEGKENLSDYEKVRLVYNYITEEIEYISVSFRQDGVIPQKASNVIISGMGDCKDVATLAKALLKTVDIEAYYVLVNSGDYNPNTEYLPSLNVFNHAIAAVDFEEKTIYLDCTAENFAMEVLPGGDRNAPSLPILKGQKELIRLPNNSEIEDGIYTTTAATLSDDGNLELTKIKKRSGYYTPSIRRTYRDLSDEMSYKKMKESLESSYNNVEITSLEFEDLESISPYVDYSYSFIAQNYLMSTGSFNILKLPFSSLTDSRSFVSYEQRETPISIWMWKGVREESIELSLPASYKLMEVPEDIQLDTKFATYSLKYLKVGNKITASRYLKVKKEWIEVDEYKEFKEFYNKLVKADAAQLLLKSI